VLDLSQEDAKTKELTASARTRRIHRPQMPAAASSFEKGVRFVAALQRLVDSHDYIERATAISCAAWTSPSPPSSLISNNAGLLDSTLIVWCGEFGRSPETVFARALPTAGTTIPTR